jgi:hypothetical protein
LDCIFDFGGVVYAMTNSPEGNQILVFSFPCHQRSIVPASQTLRGTPRQGGEGAITRASLRLEPLDLAQCVVAARMLRICSILRPALT